MAKPFPMQKLIDLAQNKTDTATRTLGRLNAQTIETAKKLQLLLDYRNDYQTRFLTTSSNGVHSLEWQNFQEFMKKLEDAIGQLNQELLRAQQRLHAGQLEVQTQRRKLKSFDTLSQRHFRTEVTRDNRREQKEQDAHATRSRTSRQTHDSD
jgi:flagellar protein FliJ